MTDCSDCPVCVMERNLSHAGEACESCGVLLTLGNIPSGGPAVTCQRCAPSVLLAGFRDRPGVSGVGRAG